MNFFSQCLFTVDYFSPLPANFSNVFVVWFKRMYFLASKESHFAMIALKDIFLKKGIPITAAVSLFF